MLVSLYLHLLALGICLKVHNDLVFAQYAWDPAQVIAGKHGCLKNESDNKHKINLALTIIIYYLLCTILSL